MSAAIPFPKSPDLEPGEEPLGKGADGDFQFPGIDVGFAFSIDEKRSLSVRTAFGRGATPDVQERILARMFNVTAVMGLRERLIENRREQKNAERRLAELTPDPAKKAELQAELDKLEADQREFAETDERKFRESGRHGVYKPAGAARNTILDYGTKIEKKREEIKALDDDMDRQRKDLRKAIENYGVAISNVENEIAIRREAYGE